MCIAYCVCVTKGWVGALDRGCQWCVPNNATIIFFSKLTAPQEEWKWWLESGGWNKPACSVYLQIIKTHYTRSQSKHNYLRCPSGTSPQNPIQSLPANYSWPQYSLYPYSTYSIVNILSNHVSDSWNVPLLKLSANFCCVLLVIFSYTAGTHISTIVASLTSLAGLLTTFWVK